ncbi:MAG TPA: glucose 1-dehydrogenase [Candidatus Binataceae bacterium]|nr:glucose 1-dehydrogenase [Candidatus Binataceae bacterium]
MSGDLEGQVAIVTGASHGIGRAIALKFAAAAAKVVLAARRETDLQVLAAEIADCGGTALAVGCHMGKQDDVARLVASAREKWQRIDIVVNNAATCPTYGPFIETTPEVWDKIMDVNLRGPFLLSRMAAAEMKERRRGRIINISSNEGLDPNPNLGAYSISKSALISMTKVLARDLGQYGIQVNCIAPGLIKTRFSEPLFTDPEKYEHYMKRIWLNRHGQPEEIAHMALFLASHLGDFITGQTIAVDGGETMV